jgi:hypothetical protein
MTAPTLVLTISTRRRNLQAVFFRKAGIKVIWILVPPANEVHEHQDIAEWHPTDLHLRLWRRAYVGPNSFSKDALAFV